MIISHQKKFIFIHIYKVGGNSIRKVLEPYKDQRITDYPLIDSMRHFFGIRFHSLTHWSTEHFTAGDLKRKLKPSVFSPYFKFSFVRNPWDWQVSLYHFMLQNKNHGQHARINAMGSFDEYIRWRVTEEFRLQRDFLCDSENNIIIVCVGRMEKMQDDFDTICDKIEIPRVKLPVINASRHEHFKSYYTAETRDMIYNRFKPDIELFGYDF